MRTRTAIVAGVASIFIALIVVVLLSVVLHLALSNSGSTVPVHSYAGGPSSFLGDLQASNVASVEIDVNDHTMKVTPRTGSVYSVDFPDITQLTTELSHHPDVAVTSSTTRSTWWPSVFWLFVPGLLIVLVVAVAIFLALRHWLRRPQASRPPADDFAARLDDLRARVEQLEKRPG